MEAKKSPKADLESKRFLFFQIGLVLAIGAILFAFEYSSSVSESQSFGPLIIEADEGYELPPITREKEPEPEQVKPQVVELFEIVDDSFDELETELDIFDSEITEDTRIDPGIIVADEVENPTEVFQFFALQDKPEFPGGMAGLNRYIASHVKYPALAQEQNLFGVVYLSFVINEQGEVENVKLLRGTYPVLDKEAIRVITHLPKWKPGKQNGQPVKVAFQVPINFHLQ